MICSCYFCEDTACVEGQCRLCFLYCWEIEPDIGHDLMMRTHKSFVSLHNWRMHQMRQRRSDVIRKACDDDDKTFRQLCAGLYPSRH